MRTGYRVARKDLSILLSLLLRLRLRKEKWGSRFHYGAFEKADARDDELADILVDGLGRDQGEGYFTPDQVRRAMDMLPNLHLRFHQLWAVLFQPPTATESQEPAADRSRILLAISLFVPQPVVDAFRGRRRIRGSLWIPFNCHRYQMT